jgi:hypothetical protein
MNNYGEIYLCFYKHDKDFLVGNKNINVAKKIKNYCKTNSSTIQDLFNYQIFKNKEVIINNYKTFYQNFYDIFFYQSKFSSQQNVEFFLRRQNLDVNWQDFVVLPKENIRKKITTLIYNIKIELKKQGIIDILNLTEIKKEDDFENKRAFNNAIFNLFQNSQSSLLNTICKSNVCYVRDEEWRNHTILSKQLNLK